MIDTLGAVVEIALAAATVWVGFLLTRLATRICDEFRFSRSDRRDVATQFADILGRGPRHPV